SSSCCDGWQGVEVIDAVLEPGDVLILPAGWLHHVEALSVSISVNVWSDSGDYLKMQKIFSNAAPFLDKAWPQVCLLLFVVPLTVVFYAGPQAVGAAELPA